MDGASENLARNLSDLRERKGLSQRQLAEAAGIPRSTLTHIESGAANPSLSNLVRLATALGLGVEELLARPRSPVKLIPAEEVPVRERAGGQVRVAKLLPERVRGMEIDRMELVPGATLRGTPHVSGTKEYLHVLSGVFTIVVAGELFQVESGDVLAFPGDRPHSYANRGTAPATAVSVVVPLPL